MPLLPVMSVIGYFLGSIPFGYLLVHIFRGEDVRLSGSGNIGATNVSRKSPALGALTLLLDALKGSCAVLLTDEVLRRAYPGNVNVSRYPLDAIVAVCAILGHMFPVWLRFRGGKGVATALGAFAALAPQATLGAFVIFVVVMLASRYVSLASIAAALSLPIFAWFTLRHGSRQNLTVVPCIAIASALVIAKHQPNMGRLLSGTESRFGSSKEK